jgi:multidrug efflux pump subunit AcrA (membrane-fusion protein)
MMTAIFRAALVAVFTAASIPTVAVGQNVSADSLLRRIDSLQRRTADLERRVSELEALIRVVPSGSRAVPASPNSQDVANWRRLRRGMKMDAVRALLGEPESVDAGYLTIWHYPGARVTFIEEKVDGWSEPRQ